MKRSKQKSIFLNIPYRLITEKCSSVRGTVLPVKLSEMFIAF